MKTFRTLGLWWVWTQKLYWKWSTSDHELYYIYAKLLDLVVNLYYKPSLRYTQKKCKYNCCRIICRRHISETILMLHNLSKHTFEHQMLNKKKKFSKLMWNNDHKWWFRFIPSRNVSVQKNTYGIESVWKAKRKEKEEEKERQTKGTCFDMWLNLKTMSLELWPLCFWSLSMCASPDLIPWGFGA